MPPEDSIVCQGREQEIPDAFLKEGTAALAMMKEEYPEALNEALERVPHIDRHLCKGVLPKKIASDGSAPWGFVLSTSVPDVFGIVSLECAASFKMNQSNNSKSLLVYLLCDV